MKEITLKSGKKIKWQICPRYILWRHGRAAHTFQLKAQEIARGGVPDPVEAGLALFESLTDEEAKKLQAFADDVIENSSDVEDVGALSEIDYWQIFGLTLYSNQNAPIQTEDGETDSQAVETFPAKPVIQASGESLSDIPGDVASAENGDSQSASA